MNATSQIEINGRLLHYSIAGEGAPLVLLHGFPLDGEMWSPQIAALSKSYQVITPNLRGFGGSTLAENDAAEGVSMQDYAADVVALLDAELDKDEQFYLAGFSMGGYVAWQLALAHVDRLRGLILCDTRAVADTPESRQGRVKMADELMEAEDSSATLAMMDKLVAPTTVKNSPNVVEQIRNMLLRQRPAAVAAAQRGMAARPDVTARLSAITCPTLVLCGEHDVISPPQEMRGIAEALPNAQYVEIPSAGHMTPLENSNAVNEAFANFLA